MDNSLIIDISEDYIYLHNQARTIITPILVKDFFLHNELSLEMLKAELKNNNIHAKNLYLTLPLAFINHQLVTLPENVSDEEKLVFLGLEINRQLISNVFGVHKLDVTRRQEGDQELCDYLVLSPKPEPYKKLKLLIKTFDMNLLSIIPSFYTLEPEKLNDLRATAWLGESRSDIVIWGKDNPLALASIPNTGDQVGDINRFIVEYFDHIDDMNLSMIYLYGPRMKDSALGFGLTYPHMIFDDPTKYVLNNFYKIENKINIAGNIKLPRPPLALTPTNLSFIFAGLALAFLILASLGIHLYSLNLSKELSQLENKLSQQKNLVSKYHALEKQIAKKEIAKDFYLSISKRRIPWHSILSDLSRMTPSELWFDRLNANSSKVLISGRARSVEDITALAINLEESAKYIQQAQLLGLREYEENDRTFNEFQISAKLKSPSGARFNQEN